MVELPIAVIVIFAVPPCIWMILTSIKPNSDTIAFPLRYLPAQITSEHYSALPARTSFAGNIVNSLAVAMGAAGSARLRAFSWTPISASSWVMQPSLFRSRYGCSLALRFLLAPGQSHDILAAPALLQGLTGEPVLAGRAYDTNALRSLIAGMGAQAVIPSTRRQGF